MGKSSKDSHHKIGILKETGKAVYQLSIEHSIFHLESVSGAVVVQSLFFILLKIWNFTRKRTYIAIASLQELKQPSKYEYFFRSL